MINSRKSSLSVLANVFFLFELNVTCKIIIMTILNTVKLTPNQLFKITLINLRMQKVTCRSKNIYNTRIWANAQRDGRPAEYRWRPLFNAAQFG